MESFEEEAGRAVLLLLQQDNPATDSAETLDCEVFHSAALRLHITSPKDLLIEKRSIKKLLDKFRDNDKRKESILKYILYLLRKYGNTVGCKQIKDFEGHCKDSISSTNSKCDNEKNCGPVEPILYAGFDNGRTQTNASSMKMPPEEFRCPISKKLMYDPVVIDSGQTYERIWIEKWLNEGHDMCPKTHKKLSHFSMTPNSCMKELITRWCRRRGITIQDPCLQPIPEAFNSWNNACSNSVSSLDSCLNSVPTLVLERKAADYLIESDISSVSICHSDDSDVKITENLKDGHTLIFFQNDGSLKCQSFADFNSEMYASFLSMLAALPFESQCKAVKDFNTILKDNDEVCQSMISNGFVEELIKFLKGAHDMADLERQKTGAQILLAFLTNIRNEIPTFCEDAFHLLVSFLNSEIAEETLAIMQVLASHESCKSKIVTSGALPSILKILDSQVGECREQAVTILYDLSSSHSGIRSHILYLGCISKLVPLLGDNKLAGKGMKILQNLRDTEEASIAMAETNGCIASIMKLLDTGTHEEQEHAVAVLLSLCSLSFDYCQLVMNEGIIPHLVYISASGSSRGKDSAKKLLLLLRYLRHDDSLDRSLTGVGLSSELSRNSRNCYNGKQPPSKISRFFGKKMSRFSRP